MKLLLYTYLKDNSVVMTLHFLKYIALFGLQSLNFDLYSSLIPPKRNPILSDAFMIQCLSFLQDIYIYISCKKQIYSKNLNICLGMPGALQLSFKIFIST